MNVVANYEATSTLKVPPLTENLKIRFSPNPGTL